MKTLKCSSYTTLLRNVGRGLKTTGDCSVNYGAGGTSEG